MVNSVFFVVLLVVSVDGKGLKQNFMATTGLRQVVNSLQRVFIQRLVLHNILFF